MATKTVTIPRTEAHEGYWRVDVQLEWVCPVCGRSRGEVFDTWS